MKTLLKLEYVGLFALGIYGFAQTECSWWWFIGLFFAPDISMLGYLINPKIGAYFYNLFHHLGIAVLVFLAGKYFAISEVEIAGIILFSHSVFDRIIGYGLKYSDSFKNTHLGRIGKNNS